MHWIDPDYLPEITGIVDQFLVNKHGEADGLLLTNGGEVHVPPHLSSRLLREVRPGSEVRVRGVRPRGVAMVAAVAVDTAKGGILDEGPDIREDDAGVERAKHGPISAEGIIKQLIHGPKGEARGAVLEDGRVIRLPPHEARRFSELLRKGSTIAVKGDGATMSYGTVIEAREIGASAKMLKSVEAKKPKHGPDEGPKHEGGKRGPEHGPKHAHHPKH